MSRYKDLGKILEKLNDYKVDAEAFKRGNPDYKTWLHSLDMTTRTTFERALEAIITVVHDYPVGEHSPFKNTALYIVGSSVTNETYNDIDIALVGMEEDKITDKIIDHFRRYIQHYTCAKNIDVARNTLYSSDYTSYLAARIKTEDDNEVSIDFLIDRSGKTIKEWEYQQAERMERYVSIKRLDEKTKGGLDAFA